MSCDADTQPSLQLLEYIVKNPRALLLGFYSDVLHNSQMLGLTSQGPLLAGWASGRQWLVIHGLVG